MEKKSRAAKVVGVSKKAVEKAPVAEKKPVFKAVMEKLSGGKPAAEKAVSRKAAIGHEELSRRIQDKAYELYRNRGLNHGDDQADWFTAEQLVRSELGL
ncbi:MAG: DUF2934 domain-containing protein [Candidatus Omnitrophota bacterium]